MAEPKAVKVLEVCLVAPQGSATSLAPTFLPLTMFDINWLRLPQAERLYYYEFPISTTSFLDSVLPNLKHSLALTLHHFLPLAGNLTWPLDSPNPIIKYVPGDAVSFTIAESNADFNHLCSDLCDAVECHPFIPHLTTSHEQTSLLALQVTIFPNFGFCIGIATHHVATDGKSSSLFTKSWAYLCSKLRESASVSVPEHLIPFYDRSVIRDPTGINASYVHEWLKHGGPNNRSVKLWESVNTIQTERIRGLFELTPSHIQKLKQFAQSKLKMKVHLSTFSVTCAYVLACLVKAKRPENSNAVFMFPADCRSRLDSAILPTYFGNCVSGQKVVVETNRLLGNDGFISALEGIIEALGRLQYGRPSVESWFSTMQTSSENRIFSIADSPRFELYSTDFGWGKPKKVDVTFIDRTGAFSLLESRNYNGGIEIGLVLNKREMEAFSALFVQGLESF